MRRAQRNLDQAKPELTPMIDVVFLLLVFFVCTIQFKVIEGRLNTELPKDQGSNPGVVEEQLMEPLELYLAAAPERASGYALRVGPVEVDGVGGLPGRVAAALAADPELRARLHVGDGVVHGQVVEVLDAVLAGGLERVSFAAY